MTWDQPDTKSLPDALDDHKPKGDLATDIDEEISVDEIRVKSMTKVERHMERTREAKGLLKALYQFL